MRRDQLIFKILLLFFFTSFPILSKANSFEQLFKSIQQVELEQRGSNRIGYIASFKVDSSGNYWIGDGGLHNDKNPGNLKVYSHTGKLIKVICGKENFQSLADFCFDSKKRIYVTDVTSTGKDVSVFDSSGNFLYSFRTLQDSSSEGVVYVLPNNIEIESRNYIFIGGRQAGTAKNIKGFLLHKYTLSGKLLGSFLPIDKKLLKLAPFLAHWVSLDLDSQGNIWVTQPLSYQVSQFSPEGKLLKKFSGKSKFYKPPYEFKGPRSPKALNTWIETWTQITDCVVTKDDLILILLRTHNPTEYVLEVYSPQGKLLAGDIQTNHYLLGKDQNGYIYFLLNEGNSKEQTKSFRIGKFSLNLRR